MVSLGTPFLADSSINLPDFDFRLPKVGANANILTEFLNIMTKENPDEIFKVIRRMIDQRSNKIENALTVIVEHNVEHNSSFLLSDCCAKKVATVCGKIERSDLPQSDLRSFINQEKEFIKRLKTLENQASKALGSHVLLIRIFGGIN